MPGTDELSQARRALIDKYLKAQTPPASASASAVSQSEQEPEEPVGRGERVVQIQSGTLRPFFYLHGDWRGQAFYCYPLAQALGPEQPFYVVEPYTFEGLAVPPPIEVIARTHVKALRRVQPHGPYLLGGWCNGGLLAYEVARQLHAQGERIDLLVLIDAMLPGRHKAVRKLTSLLGRLLRVDQEQQIDWFILVHYLYRCLRFPAYRRKTLGELGENTTQERSSQQRAGLLHIRAAVKALRQTYSGVFEWLDADYSPELYPGKITFIWVASSVAAFTREWSAILKAKTGHAEVHTIPGNDITSRTAYLADFAACLRDCVARAQEQQA